MRKIEYFLICHDQEIILNKNVKNLTNYKFLFVGKRNYEKIQKLDNVIICANLKNNIENVNLGSFNGWYAVAKNGLCENYACLLEYDTIPNEEFEVENNNLIKFYSILGYFKEKVKDGMFSMSTPWLEIALKKVYGIDVFGLVEFMPKDENWIPTTNITLNKNTLNEFVDWFLPMTEVFAEKPSSLYVHERAFKIFTYINKINYFHVLNCLEHHQSKSHNSDDVLQIVLREKEKKHFEEINKKDIKEKYNEMLRNLEFPSFHGN